MSSEDLIREANDPATAPARLAELASADRATWPALAGNPSTYEGLLTWLGERDDPAVNAALAARAQASLPQAPAEPVEPPAETPTVQAPTVQAPVAPTSAGPEQPDPEPTAVFAGPVAEPAAVHPPTSGSTVPSGSSTADGSGKNLAIVVAMVAVVIALIAGAAYGASQVFGGDDDDVKVSAPVATKQTEDAPADESEDDDSTASSEFCSIMEDLQADSQKLVERVGETPDLDDLKSLGEDMARSYDDLADSAPADLRGDIKTMGSYFELMTDPAAATKMSQSFSDYMDSTQKVSTYYVQNCF